MKSSIITLSAGLLGFFLNSYVSAACQFSEAWKEGYGGKLQLGVNIGEVIVPMDLKDGEVIKTYSLSGGPADELITNNACLDTVMRASIKNHASSTFDNVFKTNLKGIGFRIGTPSHSFPYEIENNEYDWWGWPESVGMSRLQFELVKIGLVQAGKLSEEVYGQGEIADLGPFVEIKVDNGGSIRTPTCAPSVEQMPVPLGDIPVSSLHQGQTQFENFSVELSCDEKARFVMSINAAAYNEEKGLILLNEGSEAGGVVVELWNAASRTQHDSPVRLNYRSKEPADVIDAVTEETLNYKARLVKIPYEKVKAGEFSAQATLSLDYQ